MFIHCCHLGIEKVKAKGRLSKSTKPLTTKTRYIRQVFRTCQNLGNRWTVENQEPIDLMAHPSYVDNKSQMGQWDL